MKKNMKLLSNLMLILAALIWGTQFVLQKIAASYVGPITFYGLRALLASPTLAILIFIQEKSKRRNEELNHIEHVPYGKTYFKRLIKIASCCIFLNIIGNVLIQSALKYVTVGKAGFLNAIYIIFVPFTTTIILKKKLRVNVWISTLIATVGLYFLCVTGGFHIDKWDLVILSCTIFFAIHITLVGKFVFEFQGLHFSFVEFTTAAIVCLAVGLTFEKDLNQWDHLPEILPGVLVCGILGTGVCYALQVVAQKYVNPAVASLLMSLESVFAAITGFVFLNERFTGREFIGVILVSSAIVIAQLPEKKKELKEPDQKSLT